MKNRILTLLLLLPFIISSCDDNFLTEDARSEITDEYLSTPAGFNDAVNGAYSYLRVYIENEQFPHQSTMGTDLWTNGFDGGNKHFNF
ncbi:MAG: RagB/SusD family nutrient uptake outer membrane protein, partial [Bacteroidota bacterium]|nr:RagB/SusD family nutrient uptake outer membrane protein [Bacteroidota bacterium]